MDQGWLERRVRIVRDNSKIKSQKMRIKKDEHEGGYDRFHQLPELIAKKMNATNASSKPLQKQAKMTTLLKKIRLFSLE